MRGWSRRFRKTVPAVSWSGATQGSTIRHFAFSSGYKAIQALTAAHGIPLNRIGEPVVITTGRRLGTVHEDTVVMLDGQLAFLQADPDLEIFWGAYLGSPDQILIAGRLGDVTEDIVATRQTARARHGWIMDTYLLRKPA